jgi:hypothetical protein
MPQILLFWTYAPLAEGAWIASDCKGSVSELRTSGFCDDLRIYATRLP